MTKYSLKNIALGIGIGLVLASMANISATPKSLSIDEIRREAKKNNLMVVDAKDLIQKLPEQDKEPKQQTPVPPEAPKQQTPIQPKVLVKEQTIVIKPGMTSKNIAGLLLSNKLIEDKQAFLDRLSKLRKLSEVRAGTFKIPEDASINKIIEIITSPPK